MTEGRSAQGAARSDPFEAWRELYQDNEQAWTKAMKDFYEANEKIWTKAMKDATTSQWFAEAQGKMLESFLAFQKMLREGTTAQLNALNLPTRDDVSRVGELVVGLEEKVDQVEDRLAGLEGRLSEHREERVAKLELGFSRQFEQHFAKLEKELLRHLDERFSNLEKRLGRPEKGTDKGT
ncbi:MAG: hypothetical protein HY675_17380 [Chloroflexi bacterium]|nr:hypothetical protein [Chloroflexota bacterium]